MIPSKRGGPSWPDYLTGLQGDPSARPYLEMHLTRLVHTLEITPRGSADDCGT